MPDEPIAYMYKEAISKSIDYNNGIILTAKLTATIVATDDYDVTFYMSADGGSIWEEVTNGVLHTFVSFGTDLRWKITGSGGFEITNILITDYH